MGLSGGGGEGGRKLTVDSGQLTVSGTERVLEIHYVGWLRVRGGDSSVSGDSRLVIWLG